MLQEFFQQGRRYSYGKRDRLPLLSLGQVCPADAIVPAKAVNVHQSPKQPHDQGSRRKIEAQNATAPTSQGWRRSFERAEANSRQLHSGGFPAVNQKHVLIASHSRTGTSPAVSSTGLVKANFGSILWPIKAKTIAATATSEQSTRAAQRRCERLTERNGSSTCSVGSAGVRVAGWNCNPSRNGVVGNASNSSGTSRMRGCSGSTGSASR